MQGRLNAARKKERPLTSSRTSLWGTLAFFLVIIRIVLRLARGGLASRGGLGLGTGLAIH